MYLKQDWCICIYILQICGKLYGMSYFDLQIQIQNNTPSIRICILFKCKFRYKLAYSFSLCIQL